MSIGRRFVKAQIRKPPVLEPGVLVAVTLRERLVTKIRASLATTGGAWERSLPTGPDLRRALNYTDVAQVTAVILLLIR